MSHGESTLDRTILLPRSSKHSPSLKPSRHLRSRTPESASIFSRSATKRTCTKTMVSGHRATVSHNMFQSTYLRIQSSILGLTGNSSLIGGQLSRRTSLLLLSYPPHLRPNSLAVLSLNPLILLRPASLLSQLSVQDCSLLLQVL